MIFKRFTLCMVWNLVVKDRPQDQFAVVLVVAIDVLVAAIDDVRLMLVLQLIVNVILEMSRKRIDRESYCMST
jgi:hypothetical protein